MQTNKTPHDSVCRLTVPEGWAPPEFSPSTEIRLTDDEKARLRDRLAQRSPIERLTEAVERQNELLAELTELWKKGH